MIQFKQRLIDFINRFNQFQLESELWKSIKSVLECSDSEAQALATTHCNLLSFYAILYCQNLITDTYKVFFQWCLNNKFVNNNGYFNVDKYVIFTALKLSINLIDTPIDINYPAGIYQLKINGSAGSHFIACYSEGTNMFICDSNNRGVGVSMDSGLKNTDNIVWLKQYCPE